MTSKKIGASMNDWARAFRAVGDGRQADLLSESADVKIQAEKTLKKLKLPILKKEFIALQDFMKERDIYFHKVHSEKYYINLVSHKHEQRIRAVNLDKKEVLTFIHNHIPQKEYSDYTLVLSEYFDNIYGGNIIISTHGYILLELAKGVHGDLVTGANTPTVFAERKNVHDTFMYYTGSHKVRHQLRDTCLSHAISRTLAAIPKYWDHVHRYGNYHPGYYEFVLVHKGETDILAPIFLDYRDTSIYKIPA